MTLSGGVLGVSFTILKLVGEAKAKHPRFVIIAWMCFAVSISVVVASFYLSHLAMRKAMRDLNANKLNYANPGGAYDTAIKILNPIGGILFLAGIVGLILFVNANVSP